MKTPAELKYKLRNIDRLLNLTYFYHQELIRQNMTSSFYDRWNIRLETIADKLIKAYANQSKWISVKERLPESEKSVLLYLSDVLYPIVIGALEENTEDCWYEWGEDRDIDSEPLYWQPLPEPPKQ